MVKKCFGIVFIFVIGFVLGFLSIPGVDVKRSSHSRSRSWHLTIRSSAIMDPRATAGMIQI